jgi:hypothetical protein
MARELAIPCFLARIAAAIALLVIGSVLAEPLVLAAETSTIPEAPGGTRATDSGVLEKIIPTARKRAEHLPHTSVAIITFSQQDAVVHSLRSLDSQSEQPPRRSVQQSSYDTFGRVK